MWSFLRYLLRILAKDGGKFIGLWRIAIATPPLLLKFASNWEPLGFLAEHLTWTHVIYLTLLLALGVVCWRALRSGFELERKTASRVRLKELKDYRESLEPGKTFVEITIEIENSGIDPLNQCLVQVLELPNTASNHGLPRAIRTAAQRNQDRSGQFNLRGGETKKIPICHYTITDGDTFARVFVNYEDDIDRYEFDPDNTNTMTLGFFSESAPRFVTLKFERNKDGFVCFEWSSNELV